jgi:hypothetical protein
MTVRSVISAALFLTGIGCIAHANFLFGDIVADVNRLHPPERAISLLGLGRHQLSEVRREYKRLYPDGKLVLKYYIWAAVGLACVFGSAVYWFFSQARSAG